MLLILLGAVIMMAPALAVAVVTLVRKMDSIHKAVNSNLHETQDALADAKQHIRRLEQEVTELQARLDRRHKGRRVDNSEHA